MASAMAIARPTRRRCAKTRAYWAAASPSNGRTRPPEVLDKQSRRRGFEVLAAAPVRQKRDPGQDFRL